MVQVIGGPEQILGPALAQIAGSIAQAIRPDHLFQKKFREVLAVNPGLIGQLADVENQAPGTLQGLGLGDIGNVISAVGPSLNAMLEQEGKNFISDPTNRTEVVSKKLTGQTPDERTITKGRAEVAGATIEALKDPTIRRKAGEVAVLGKTQQQVDTEDAEAQLKLESTLAGLELLKEDGEAGLDKLLSGQYTPKQLAGIFSVPGVGNALRLQYDAAQDKIRNDLARQRLQVDRDRLSVDRTSVSAAAALDRLQLSQAAKIVMETGRGTPEGVRQVLYGGVREKIENELISKDPATLTAEEKDLMESWDAVQTLNKQQKAQEIASHTKDLISAMNSAKGILRDPELGKKERQQLMPGIVAEINSILESRAILGARRYTAEYVDNDGGYLGRARKEIVFKDEAGKVVPEAIAQNITEPSAGKIPTVTSETIKLDSGIVQQFVTRIKANPSAREDVLTRLQETNPEYYEAVKSLTEPRQ